MASTVDDITIEYVDGGVVTVKQINKVILTKGAWATIMFEYEDWDKRKEAYGPRKYSIQRFQKKNNEYKRKSKFNISSKDQAMKIIAVLNEWIA